MGTDADAQGVRRGGGRRLRLRQRRHRRQLPDRSHRGPGRQLHLLRLQGRHRVRDHDRGAALATTGVCSAAGSASDAPRAAGSCWARWRWPRRGWWPPPCHGQQRYVAARAHLHRALRRAGALLRSRGRPRRQPLARPSGVLRHRRLRRRDPRHARGVAVPRRACSRRCSPPAWWPRWSACRSSASPSTRSPSARSAWRWSPRIVATNWVEVTRGPLCITGIPKPRLGALAITTLPAFYWLALTALVAVALLYRGLTTFRLGRAFHAVRDNEPLAGAAGIDPAQVPPAGLHPRRRHRGRDRRALRPLPLGDVPGGDDRAPHGQPAGHRLPRAASAACAECWSAPCSSPHCPRCCVSRRRGGS